MLRMLSAVRALRSSAEILARAADAHHTAGTRRVSAARIAPTSGKVVTEFQSGSARTDSPVRILHAQPGSWSPTAQRRQFRPGESGDVRPRGGWGALRSD